MSRELSGYHREVAERNRAAIIAGARVLFLEHGYDRTSLARVAVAAGVSKATLFKQFPTKAMLFEAVILAVGEDDGRETPDPGSGDLRAGLRILGRRYAELLSRPQTADLLRLVIAEGPRFPELRERTFDFGTLPTLAALGHYLRDEQDAGRLRMDSRETASAQFLGMIAGSIFWPRLVHPGWAIDDDEISFVLEEAVETFLARYAA